MELSVQTRTYLVLGIMVCCFAVLYPKIFHPMIMACLGMRQSSSSSASSSGDWPDSAAHPRLRRPMPGGASSGGPGGPGGRMAAEHAASMQARQQSGGFGGKGNVVGLILPVYAIGIVLYLVYTLVKVMGGFKSNNANGNNGRNGNSSVNDYYKNFHFDPLSGEFVDNNGGNEGPGDRRRNGNHFSGGSGDVGSAVDPAGSDQNRYERMHRDLEKLLRRVDDQDISENELVQLRSRLEETERQMTTILSAMQNLQHKQASSAAATASDAVASTSASPEAVKENDAASNSPAKEADECETRHRKAYPLASDE